MVEERVPLHVWNHDIREAPLSCPPKFVGVLGSTGMQNFSLGMYVCADQVYKDDLRAKELAKVLQKAPRCLSKDILR